MDESERYSRGLDVQKVLVRHLTIDVFYDVKSRSSFCWKYFGNLVRIGDDEAVDSVVDQDKVFCFACLTAIKMESEDVTFGSVNVKSYKRSVSTGNLTRHLREMHMILEEIHEESDPEPSTTTNHEPAPKRRKTRTHMADAAVSTEPVVKAVDKDQLATDLAIWFCKSLMPFEYISDGMAEFFKKYDLISSDDDLPTRDAVNFTVNNIYKTILEEAKNNGIEDDANHLSLAFDTWSDRRRGTNYITTTLHLLTSDFYPKSINVGTQIVDDKTGKKIKCIIKDTKTQFSLPENSFISVHAVTRSEENVKQVLSEEHVDHHLCIGHGFHNLVVIDGISAIPEIKTLVIKCKKLVQMMTQRLQMLECRNGISVDQKEFLSGLGYIASSLDSDENDPIPDSYSVPDVAEKSQNKKQGRMLRIECVTSTAAPVSVPTRWHNVLAILECFHQVSNRDQFRKFIKFISTSGTITKCDWTLIEQLVVFLRKFREVVEVVSAQKTCTINVALLFRSEIKDILNSAQSESTIIEQMKHNMLSNIDRRLPVTRTIVAAALLDNRFIGLKEVDLYLDERNQTRFAFLAETVREILTDTSLPYCKDERDDSDDDPLQETSLLNKLVEKHRAGDVQEMVKIRDPIEKECWMYLAMANQTEPKDGDLLGYWRSKHEEFPWLGALARALLCVPATSAPAAKMFSDTGLDFSTKRSRLNPCALSKIIFIHDNYEPPKTKKERKERNTVTVKIKSENID